MLGRVLLAAVVATTLLASGCSGSKSTTPSTVVTGTKGSSAQASESAAPTENPTETSDTAATAGPKLDANACVDITGANLDLATATNDADARKAGDVFEKYDPPAEVKNAVEHFVGTGGAQFDDPEYDKYNKVIDEWVKQVCPLG